MIKRLAKDVGHLLLNISGAEYSERRHQVEYIGKYMEDGKQKDVICTVQLKHYIPRDVYGEAGYFYEKPRKRKARDENRKWIVVEDVVTYYELSKADKKFIYVSYVHHHLDQRQISKLSGIPQPYVYRYIKHMKLKPKYSNTPKSQRNVDFLEELRGELDLDTTVNMSDGTEKIENIIIPDDIDFDKSFHVNPYPNRAEWKVQREELGLKNGEDWRNHNDADGEITAKVYGDGSTVRRKKNAKLKRREERRRKNIKKFNLHQNNRYGMTVTNPEGTRHPKDKNKDNENK